MRERGSRPGYPAHDRATQPLLECHDWRMLHQHIDAQRRLLERDARQRKANRDATSRTEACVETSEPAAEPAIEPPGERDGSDLDVSHARRLTLTQLENDPVDLPGVLPGRVDELIIEDVANEEQLHHDPPMISSGIETTATIPESTLITRIARLPNQPFVCSPRYLLSFMRMRKGSIATGSDAAVSAIDNVVSLRGSMPTRTSSIETRRIRVYVRLNRASSLGPRSSPQFQPKP